MVPAVPPEFAPVEVDRVVWSPTGPDSGTVEVVVEGRWRGTPLPTTPLLLVEEAGLRRRFGARGEQLPGPAGAFSAAFSLPARLRDELQAGAALRMGAAEMALPAARVGATVAVADVVAPSVLVHRRAQREQPAALVQRIEEERDARARAEAERDALAREIAAARAAAPETGVELEELRRLRARVDDLNDALVTLAAELRVRLRDEAAARWVAEAELRTERAHVGALRAEVVSLRGERPAIDEPAAMPPAFAPPPGADATIANLGRAAERLRERAEHLAADALDDPAPPVASEEDLAAIASPADDPEVLAQVVDGFGVTVELDALTPDGPAEPEPEAAPRVERVVELAPRVVSDQLFTFWLTNAIERLDEVDRRAAADAVVALLPLQGPAMRRRLTYDLMVEPLAPRRITLGKRTFAVEELAAEAEMPKPDVAVSGTPANVAPLVAGGAWRRMTLETTGRKRRLKRLFRARRGPVTLGDAVRAGLDLDCGVALRLLAVSVKPEWTAGYVFHVGYRVGDGAWLIRVADGRPLVVTDEADASATATVEAPSCAGLLAHLTRTEPPAEGPTTVAGDAAAAAALSRWFDRAQGFKVL
jgi:hypothetical protein